MIRGLDKIMNERPTLIKNIRVGQKGYAVPWGSVILKNGDVYLNGMYDIEPESHGTLELYIEKTTNGFIVDYSKVERFDSYADTLDDKVKGVMGSKKEDWIKVGNVTEEYKRSLTI